MWIDASFVREIANRLRGKGCPVDQRLRRHSISAATLKSGESVDVAVLAELLEYGAEWLGDPHFGLTCARDMRIHTLGQPARPWPLRPRPCPRAGRSEMLI